MRAKKTRTSFFFFGYRWNSSSNSSCLWGFWKAGFWPQRLKKSERPSIPQPALSRHLSGMTSELAQSGLELLREQSHMIIIPAPSTSCTKPMFVLSTLYPSSQSALRITIAFSMPLFHRWWNIVPKSSKAMFKVKQQRRCRTRTWTQALLLQGQCLSPHYSYGAYRTWMKLFLKLYFRIKSWP